MSKSAPQLDREHFERKIQNRIAELRREIEGTRDRRNGEQFAQVAGEARDAGDDSVALLNVDTRSAEIGRDDQELRALDQALGRIAAGSYGICLRCGAAIEVARLEANPAAERHLRCQEAHEREFGGTATPSL